MQRQSSDEQKPVSNSDTTVPSLPITTAQNRDKELDPTTARTAIDLFTEHGILLLKDVFDPTLLQAAHQEFMGRHGIGVMLKSLGGGVGVGHQRIMIGIELSGIFSSPDLFASPIVMQLMRALLGQDLQIGSFTAVVSRPGARDQNFHKDHPPLSENEIEAPYAITLMVPLIPLDATNGATCFVKGSQLSSMDEAKAMPRQIPTVALGSCYIMDYRLAHYGLANRSPNLRPVLSIVHQRKGFKDQVNFNAIVPVNVPDATQGDFAPEHLTLLGKEL